MGQSKRGNLDFAEIDNILNDDESVNIEERREAVDEKAEKFGHYHVHKDRDLHYHEHESDEGHALHGKGHTHAEGTGHEHGHHGNHTHTHVHTKAVLNRLARAIGHLEAIKRMVEDGRDCSEVLIQLAAVRSAINNTGKVILKDHIDHCIVDAVETGDTDALDALNRAIAQFVK